MATKSKISCYSCLHFNEPAESPFDENPYCMTCRNKDNYVNAKERSEDIIGFGFCALFAIVSVGSFIYAVMMAPKG